jgi:outer membrane protein assembly factor BamB
MRRSLLLVPMVSLVLVAPACAEDNWPQFRGPHASGTSTDKGLPTTWSTTHNVAWKLDIPGRGWSSPIVWGDKVFLTAVLREDKGEDPKKGLYFGGERFKVPTDEHRWVVYCIDRRKGSILWERVAHRGVPTSTVHLKNSYASETPVTDGERVYVYFGNVGVYCYDLAGNPVWSQTLGSYKTRLGWGTAASPVLHQDRLYIVNDNEEKSFLVALDKKTGKQVWRVERDEKSNWATPFVWENDQRTELVTAGSGMIRSYDLEGKLLWELGGMSKIAIPTPCSGHGLLYLSSGYVLDAARPLFAVRPGASGDISLKKGETSNAYVAWSQRLGGPYNPSPVLYGDYLYVLYDGGRVSCFDARTGKPIYDKERLDDSPAFTASPWAYDGKVFCLSEDGDTFVVQAGPEFKVLGKNSLSEMCLATPAIADHALFLRTMGKLYRIQEGASAPEK